MSKRSRRKQQRQRSAPAAPAQKDYGTFWGPGTSGLWMGAGTTGRNSNLSRTEWGAATAYQIVPEVNRAISLRAAAISALKWEIVRHDDKGDEIVLCKQDDIVPRHSLARAINDTYDYSNQSFFALLSYSHDLCGEIFIQKTWTQERGRGIYWLNPLGTTPIIAGRIVNFQYTSQDGGKSEVFQPREIAYFHNRSPYSDYRGMGLTQVVMQKINIARNLDDFVEDFFNNNARPSVLVSPPGDMPFSDDQITQLRAQLDNFLKGRGNNWSSYISKIGAKYTPMDQPNIGDHYTIAPVLSRYIYTVYGVPLAIAGDDSGTQYKTGDDVQIAFYQNTIIPLATELAKFVNTQIMPYFDTSGAFLRFDTSEFDLVSTDDDLRSQIATRNMQAGLWTRNRALEYTKETSIPKDDYLLIENIPIPVSEVSNYWKYKLTVSPAQELAPTVGEDLDVPGADDVTIGTTPAPQQLRAGADMPAKPEPEQPAQIPGKATQVNADDELRSWEKKSTRNWKAAFEPLHLRGDLGDMIADGIKASAGDASAIKSVFAKAREALAFKAIQATRLDFENDFDDLLGQAMDGSMDKRTFSASLRYLLNKFGRKAYLDGLQDGGVDTDELDDDDKATIATMLADQSKYVTDLANAVYKSETVTDAQADVKAAMWYNKSIDPFYQAATLSADGNSMREWVLGKTEQHCPSCGALAGGRHRYKEYAKRGWLPRASQLKCEGFNCDCQLVKVKGRARGRWPVATDKAFDVHEHKSEEEAPKPKHDDRFNFEGWEITPPPESDQKAWDESKHPRADDGKFGHGGGASDGEGEEKKPEQEPEKKPKKKPKPKEENPTDKPEQDDRQYRDFGAFPETMVSDSFQPSAPKPTDKQHEAMEYYRDISGNADLNRNLRTGKPLSPEGEKHARELDTLLANSKLEHDTMAYRGLSSDNPQSQVFRQQLASGQLKVGSTLTDKGYASTTLNSSIADEKFGDGGVVFKIKAPKGSDGLYMNAASDKYLGGRYDGEFRDEKELLLPRNSQYKIGSIEKKGNSYVVEMTYEGVGAGV